MNVWNNFAVNSPWFSLLKNNVRYFYSLNSLISILIALKYFFYVTTMHTVCLALVAKYIYICV